MKRIIKFRAWTGSEMDYDAMVDKKGRIWDMDGESAWLWHEQPEVIMQFTGLTDKNGKEIYEGDIVKYKALSGFDCGWNEDFEGGDKNSSEVLESIREVKFINGEFTPRHESSLVDDGYYSWRAFDFEVIGNIYENPELINP